MRYTVSISAFASALCFVFAVSQDGAVLMAVLSVVGAACGANALSSEEKMVKRLVRLKDLENQPPK